MSIILKYNNSVSFNYDEILSNKLTNLKNEGRYRIFHDVARKCGSFPVAHLKDKGNVTIWCSNDYLGMGQHNIVLNAMKNTIDNMGAGAGGTRNISGTHNAITKLETTISRLHKKESALVFTSGYVANEATLSTLPKLLDDDCVIFSDAQNHASMIHGIRQSGVKRHIFYHNDMVHLRKLLLAENPSAPKIIAFESIYSMDGDIGKIAEICDLAKEFNAITYLDEVHAVGMYGDNGAGIAEQENLANKVDIIQGTLGKAYGVMGGYIAANANIIDAVRSFSPSFIFTTTLPPCIANGAKASIEYLMQSNIERTAHQKIAIKLKQKLSDENIDFLQTNTHIIPVIIGDAARCKRTSDILLEKYNIYVQPINYPTVAKGTERLRITPSPLHTKEMMNNLVTALKEILG